MNSNNPYRSVPMVTPVVTRAVVMPPRARNRRMNASNGGLCFIATCVAVMAMMSVSSGIVIIIIGVFPFASLPFLIIGCLLLFGSAYLYRKGCCSSSSHENFVPAQVATRRVGGPVVGQVVNYPTTSAAGQVVNYPTTSAAGQVVNYPTTPAAPNVPGGLVSTYTYTPLNQPSPAQAPPPTGGQAPSYPSPGQVSAPAYPSTGGHTTSYPADQKPPLVAPGEASAPEFEAPPSASSTCQAPPPYTPSEEPPPYSS